MEIIKSVLKVAVDILTYILTVVGLVVFAWHHDLPFLLIWLLFHFIVALGLYIKYTQANIEFTIINNHLTVGKKK